MNKILIAGLAGGVAFFFLGWLFYGILFSDYMMANSGGATGLQKEPMDIFHLIIGQLAWGFLFAIIFGRWSNVVTLKQGAVRGAILGLLVGLFIDLTMYATTNISTIQGVFADVAIMTVIAAIGGAVVAFVLGTGKKAAVV